MVIVARIFVFLLGLALLGGTLFSAVQSIVLPRGAPDILTRFVFRGIRRLFEFRIRYAKSYRAKDRVMAFYAPVSILALLPSWLVLVLLGYTGIYWALGAGSWYESLRISGSSLLTLGYSSQARLAITLLELSEATIGLMLVALLIAYLPSMYSAFQRREQAVTLLEVRAGQPPSAIEMLLRYQRIHGLDRLSQEWALWENWFADVGESHTSLAPLVFFRSPLAERSWINAAGAVLDAAALRLSAIDLPFDPQAALCIRAGYLALWYIADFFRIDFNHQPHYPDEPVSITREMYDLSLARLEAGGVPLKADRDQAWLDYAGWRVNYDRVLASLSQLILAPPAPWSGMS